MKYFIYYIVFASVVAFILYGVDKRKAQNHQWRVPEKVLLLSALLGGTLGAFFGMLVFHHKIAKKSFMLKFFAVVIIQIILIILYFKKIY